MTRKEVPNMACETSKNKDTCPCTEKCENHGHCCACIALHRSEGVNAPVTCMLQKFDKK